MPCACYCSQVLPYSSLLHIDSSPVPTSIAYYYVHCFTLQKPVREVIVLKTNGKVGVTCNVFLCFWAEEESIAGSMQGRDSKCMYVTFTVNVITCTCTHVELALELCCRTTCFAKRFGHFSVTLFSGKYRGNAGAFYTLADRKKIRHRLNTAIQWRSQVAKKQNKTMI